MEILIFVLVLVALILVHEFGHFVAAKIAGMRVDEFGLGYPPRAAKLGTWGETEITLNWLPFGGFVKIFGEDGLEDEHTRPKASRAFASKPRYAQAIVLVAGIAMNLVFAFVLLTWALAAGTPRALTPDEVTHATNVELTVASVLAGSPAALAGVVPGDEILSAEDGHFDYSGADPAAFSSFVTRGEGNTTIALKLKDPTGAERTVYARPIQGLVVSDPTRYALGVDIAPVGVVPVSLAAAIPEGALLTWNATVLTAQGLVTFFAGIFTLHANLADVSGPVGIAGAVGSAAKTGLGDLLSLTALISINLALINLIPVPALDGGRLLFVLIEAVIRRPIKPAIAQTVNAIGFALLILLMVVVTAHDIFKIVG